ncbi:DUF4179 domain-containing protein [Eisenbergiella sp.]
MKSELLWDAMEHIDEARMEAALEQMEPKPAGRKRKRNKLKKGIAAIAAAALVIMVGTPLLAAESPAFYQALYSVSPSAAQFFIPVRKACVDNGIRMEVESAGLEGDTARIYVSLQDLEGNRIDETTDLFDSYAIRRSFDSVGTCSRVSYDKETGKATFLIEITAMDGKDIKGGKITFSVREFISGKTAMEDIPIELEPADLARRETTDVLTDPVTTGGGYSWEAQQDFGVSIEDEAAMEELGDKLPKTVLLPGESLYSPMKNLDISAAGYMDGMLHIQLRMKEKIKLDPHGFVYLMNEKGERLEPYCTVYFAEHTESNDLRVDYGEIMFKIPKEKLEEYKLYGSFYTAGRNVKGDWRVTFSL